MPGPLSDREMTGTVDLILYGANHGNDLETIAILDNDGDGYVFELYAPEFNFRIIRHVPAHEAIAEARRFVSWHRSFHEIRSSAVLDEKGQIVGYEIRPLYYPFDFGISDVLDVDYIIRGKKIVVKIRLENSVERMLMDGSDGLNIDLR